jgi:hypothetical protein
LNLGTITAGANAFGIRVNNGGSVVMLVNAQGGNTPLTYSGALPATYNVFVQSLSNFGRLAVTGGSGTMTFGVDSSWVIAVNRYTNVLTGVAACWYFKRRRWMVLSLILSPRRRTIGPFDQTVTGREDYVIQIAS